MALAASPHTRGWTRRLDDAAAARLGFPAHAGMDPWTRWCAAARSGLPRTRGDGPALSDRGGHGGRASPHTRGWTPGPAGVPPHDLGFPAHAGMDPAGPGRPDPPGGLPRTRGDGPVTCPPVDRAIRASPHTRGWTRLPDPTRRRRPGFPAHAGMDRIRADKICACGGLPRTRGDGPGRSRRRGAAHAASPHTRGWTRGRRRGDADRRGFPAHAGMDPGPSSWGRALRRLPRTRGDGPCSCHATRSGSAASPHTRGWTPRRTTRFLSPGGFPAHAGMDLRSRPFRRHSRWLPRTRGDGPASGRSRAARPSASPHTRGWTAPTRRRAVSRIGFPAHAGMDPWSRWCSAARAGLPRTRGDGPARRVMRPPRAAASPHTRGWTHGHAGQRVARNGFPAHAGMDPWSRSGKRAPTRLPRTRGDGPCLSVNTWSAPTASPHTRGWTAIEILTDRQ